MATKAPQPLPAAESRRIARLRLAAQRLLAPPLAGPATGSATGVATGAEGAPPSGGSRGPNTGEGPGGRVHATVSRMGMMQAQDLRQALWAVGVRTPGVAESAVRAAFGAGRVVRTWGARGTLMLLAAEDVAPLLSTTGPRMWAQAAARLRELGIDDADIESLLRPAREICAPAGATRAQLLEACRAAGQDTAGQRGAFLLLGLALKAGIVQGPFMDDGGARRPQQLFVTARPARCAPADFLPRFAERYFLSHGPATEQDLAWWLGLPLGLVRPALDAVSAHLALREVAGRRFWMDPAVAALWDSPPGARSVLALPGFDELLLGYRDRSATLPAEHLDAVVPGGNGVFRPVLVSGGVAAGTWRDGVRTGAVDVPDGFEGAPGTALARGFGARMREYRSFRGA